MVKRTYLTKQRMVDLVGIERIMSMTYRLGPLNPNVGSEEERLESRVRLRTGAAVASFRKIRPLS